MADGTRRLFRHEDFALAQPFDQVFGRQIDQLDLVGLFQHLIGQGLAYADAGDARDDVVQTLQMLDVQRRIDVDAGFQNVLDVLVAFGVATARRIGVGDVVDQRQLGPAGQHRVDVQLLRGTVAADQGLAGQDLQAAQQRVGLLAAMSLDQGHHDVDPVARAALRVLEHRVGLADARGGAEEDLEPATRLRRRGIVGRNGLAARLAYVGHGALNLPLLRCTASGGRARDGVAGREAGGTLVAMRSAEKS